MCACKPKAAREGLANHRKSGWLLTRGPHPICRRQAQRFAEMGDRGLFKVREAKQCFVRNFAHLPDGLQAGRKQRVPLSARCNVGLHGLLWHPEALASAQARSFPLRLQPLAGW